MTKPKALKPPSLLLHKPSGRAFVMARDESGKRRAVFLGEHGTAEAERNYRQFLSEFYGGHPLRVPQPKKTNDGLTVEELCAEFLLHAESRYRKHDGASTGEALNFAHAFRQLLELYRDIPAAELDVTMLEAVQQTMVRDGLARSSVNSRVSRIRRTYRWAARKKLVAASVWHELQTLPGLRRGEHAVREAEPVRPVPEVEIAEVLPFVAPQVQTMIGLQMSTGMRPGEVVVMRMGTLDRRDPEAWIYRPTAHKNAWRDQDRTIPLLPADQELLKPFLRLDDKPLFSPREAERSRGREVDCADTYDTRTYRKAITRGVMHANAARVRARLLDLLDEELTEGARERIAKLPRHALIASNGKLRKDIESSLAPMTGKGELLDTVAKDLAKLPLLVPFGPNRIRHLAATKAAAVVGDDGVQLLLGHADGRTLRFYVQRDPRRVVDVRKRLG